MKKICFVTGTRAEYGLMAALMKAVKADGAFELQIIATGMHLSPEFGSTYREIEKDGFSISRKVESLLSSDSKVGVAKAMGLVQIGFADALDSLRPDLVIVLGDRFEILAAVSTAATLGIPVAHLNGGEITEGAVDDMFRHAITKMSHLHFPATETYRRRIIQMGECAECVHNVGFVGLDEILNETMLTKEELEADLGITFGANIFLVTFHPVTLEGDSSGQCHAMLNALEQFDDTTVIFTKANADAEGRTINRMIGEFAAKKPERYLLVDSMGRKRYLSCMAIADAVIGNSSSGITEAPSFKTATINIGSRQDGREKAESVIDVAARTDAIADAIRMIRMPEFREKLSTVKNPYGEGDAIVQILEILKQTDLERTLKKTFVDLET